MNQTTTRNQTPIHNVSADAVPPTALPTWAGLAAQGFLRHGLWTEAAALMHCSPRTARRRLQEAQGMAAPGMAAPGRAQGLLHRPVRSWYPRIQRGLEQFGPRGLPPGHLSKKTLGQKPVSSTKADDVTGPVRTGGPQ